MKQIKFIFWVIIFVFLALLIFQNQEFFFAKTTLNMDFYFNENKNPIPPVPNVLLFSCFFFMGLFIAYIFSLFGQFKAKKTVKNLNATLQAQMEVISGLKSEIAAKDTQLGQLQNQTTVEPKPEQRVKVMEEKTEMSAETNPNDVAPVKEEENKIS